MLAVYVSFYVGLYSIDGNDSVIFTVFTLLMVITFNLLFWLSWIIEMFNLRAIKQCLLRVFYPSEYRAANQKHSKQEAYVESSLRD